MQTRILTIDPRKPDFDYLADAADALRKGSLVAFPTDTVYGLGVNALDERAIKRLFAVKKRPLSKPVAVLVFDEEHIDPLVTKVTDVTHALVKKFWPGPLTLVVERSEAISPLLSGGTTTIGLRCPNNKIALSLLRMANVPLATTSANLSGGPTATDCDQVLRELDGKIDVAIDGGPCLLGTESTVLDVTVSPPRVIRPGAIKTEQIMGFLERSGLAGTRAV